jgi:hypothetical protein
MGGSGSGRWYRWDKKDTVEDCRSLDVNRWNRERMLRPGTSSSWYWMRNGEKQASIGMNAVADALELSYTISPNTDRAEEVRYRVPLTWTPCAYGGKRPWFVCPGVVNGRRCGRRVGKLYLHGKYFLCRHCQDLVYECQRETAPFRTLHRFQKICGRLGADPPTEIPPRPKRMHWRTYLRLARRAEQADEEALLAVVAWTERPLPGENATRKRGRRR